MTVRILQLCPHDSMPFGELCRFYSQAAARIDAELTTVFLAPPSAKALPGAHYLNATDLQDTRSIARQLDGWMTESRSTWDLVLCHRYRAYWVAALSQLESRTCVAIAHEFGMLRRLQRRLSRKIYAREVAFAGVSPAVTAELAAVVGDAHLLPNGMDLSGFLERLQSPEQALAQLQLDPGPFTVGVVGRLHYKKRPELALAAFRKFRDVIPDSRLVFVGDGEPLVDEPGIHFLGRVADVRYLFCAFDALLVTSTQDEAFGMVALEAMAAGVPVATAPIPGPSYVLDDLGLYAQQANVDGYVAALIAAQHSDRATLREAGRQRVAREFSVSAAASRLDDLLTDRLTNRQTY